MTLDPTVCVRCAACAIVAPRTFELARNGTRVLRQPEDAAEHAACRAAALLCPTQAIRARPA